MAGGQVTAGGHYHTQLIKDLLIYTPELKEAIVCECLAKQITSVLISNLQPNDRCFPFQGKSLTIEL